ncbi:MAG: RagB/SusD family nutrient uptake outer membrane protein [Capnocytophaga sp.]|nr:RagB/SusD family nutrient uptake outer membrane protein [Capnocytophaga sp.]
MKKHLIYSMTALAVLLAGCSEDYLETSPTNQISEATIAGSLDNLYVALNGIHRKMVSQDLQVQGLGGEPGFIIAREAMGDDMTWQTNTWYQDAYLAWGTYKNTTSVYNYGMWDTYYKFILNANKILEGLDVVKGSGFTSASDQTQYNEIRGEALCIRAWAHFNLVQYYAPRYAAGTTNSQPGVMYRTSSEVVNMARNTVEEVYQFVNADLDEAITLLDGYKANDINHYTQKVAYGLKARVLLTQQNYPEAAQAAVNAINAAEADGHKMMTYDEVNNGFANISTATKDALYAALTLDDQTVYFYSFYAYMSWNFNASAIRQGVKGISQSTYDLMSATDVRRSWWDPAGTASVPASSYVRVPYQNRKFTARTNANPVGDFAFMRLSEMYLTAAEAYARAGQDADAKTYLQAFIAERDKSYTDLGNTGDALAEEVMTHRRIELWGEGFRWFDLKRLNQTLNRTGSNFNVAFCGFLTKQPADEGWYFEIPQRESDFNDLIVKNY